MNEFIQLMAALFGSLGFAMIFNIHGKKLIWAAFGGFYVWAIYLLWQHIFGSDDYISAFAASSLLTLYAELMARWHKTPVTVFLVSGSIPLIPGASLYRTMNWLMGNHTLLFRRDSIYTILFATSMAAGITATTLIFRMIWGIIIRHHLRHHPERLR